MAEISERPPRSKVAAVLAWLGLGGHLAIGTFPFSASGLVLTGAPWVAAMLLWVSGLVAVIILWRRRSMFALVVPVVALALWFALVWAYGSS